MSMTPAISKFGILDPRVDLSGVRSFPILKSGQTNTFYVIPSQASSDANWNWSIIPPSQFSVLDRNIILHAKATLTFTGTTSDGSNLLQEGKCGLRSHPLSRIINTLTANFNSNATTIQLSQIIPCLERTYQNVYEAQCGINSIQPCALDNAQTYGDMVGSISNPLGWYGDSSVDGSNPRGGYYMNITQNTSTNATVIVDLYEYLVLPPFEFAGNFDGRMRKQPGLTHLDNFTITATLSNLERMWCNANPALQVGGGGLNPSTATISSLTVTFGNTQPELHLVWITPRIVEEIPPEIYYNFAQVNTYPSSNRASLAPNASATITSNVIQFQSVPSKLYIWAQRSLGGDNNSIYGSLAGKIGASDSFCQINGISIQFNNISGLLSAASPQQLWKMSVDNGLNMSYQEWFGLTTRYPSSGSPVSVGTTGSLLVIDPVLNFGLDSDLATGSIGQFNFQVSQLTVKNVNQIETLSIDLFVVVTYPGLLKLGHNAGLTQVGFLTKEDVLSTPNNNHMDFCELTSVYGAGDFFSSLGNILGKLNNLVKDSGVVSSVLGELGPVGRVASKSLHNLTGYGEDSSKLGGKALTRKAMQKRLAGY